MSSVLETTAARVEVETRNFMGPRSFDNAGIPLHADNQTIIKERIYRDKQNSEIAINLLPKWVITMPRHSTMELITLPP